MGNRHRELERPHLLFQGHLVALVGDAPVRTPALRGIEFQFETEPPLAGLVVQIDTVEEQQVGERRLDAVLGDVQDELLELADPVFRDAEPFPVVAHTEDDHAAFGVWRSR
jgi:hypothetical protein